MQTKKPWAEMTEAEINRIKKAQCTRCAYSTRSSTTGMNDMTCDYIGIVGHRRPCRPDECMERGVFRLRGGARRKKGITLPVKPKPEGESGQQDERFKSLVSAVMERHGCTRAEAIDSLRRWVEEQEKIREGRI